MPSTRLRRVLGNHRTAACGQATGGGKRLGRGRCSANVITLLIQNQPDRRLANLRRISRRVSSHNGSHLSQLGASRKAGAVHQGHQQRPRGRHLLPHPRRGGHTSSSGNALCGKRIMPRHRGSLHRCRASPRLCGRWCVCAIARCATDHRRLPCEWRISQGSSSWAAKQRPARLSRQFL